MISYKLSPYLSFVQNDLVPGLVLYGVAHRLTGELLEPNERVRLFLRGMKPGIPISLAEDQLECTDEVGRQLKQLIEKSFLIPVDLDPLSLVIDQFVVRPIQNPAIRYKSEGQTRLVRTSLAQQVYAPRKDDFPEVFEDELPPIANHILGLATGDKTLLEIFRFLHPDQDPDLLRDQGFRSAIDFLTEQERQLIKFTSQLEDRNEPYKPVNTVPRNLVHAHRWDEVPKDVSPPIIDFHLRGIEDAWWEFDQIEATVNHALRFPDEVLGGFDYGSRFCVSTLTPQVLNSAQKRGALKVLEIGAGTGTFARSFITQAKTLHDSNQFFGPLDYYILDLAPELMANQKRILGDLLLADHYFQQDATKFDLPEHRFDLIVSNEVLADFPVASVRRRSSANADQHDAEWEGDGVAYLKKYDITTDGAPDDFLVNVGALNFVERCWKHLLPGGTLVISEYGKPSGYPKPAYHLNHEEYSIHFGHLEASGTKLGFSCRLLTLSEFLQINDEIEVFAGREEHILCLNHLFQQHDNELPYAIVSQVNFEKRLGPLLKNLEIDGISFLKLKKGFYFGPRIEDFMVLIMNKPMIKKDSEHIESLTQAKFAEFINTRFSVRAGETEELEFELVEVSELKTRQPLQEEFSIVFRGPKEKPLAQSILSLSHKQLGQFELFLVPIRQDPKGIYYEAIFNRLRRQAD